MLRQGHRDLHDPRGYLHPPLPLLRRRPRPAEAAGCGGTAAPGENHRRDETRLRGDHQRRSRRPEGRRRTAFHRLYSRRPGTFSENADRSTGAGLPQPSRAGARHPGGCAAGRDEPQPGNRATAVPNGAPGLGLREFAAPVEGVQGDATGRADQIRPDGGPGRNRR